MNTQKHTIRLSKSYRQLAVLLLLLFTAFGVAACSEQEKEQQAHTAENTKEMTLPVEGMSCNSCVAHVKSSLKPMEGVQQVAVSLEKRNATISYDPDKVSPEQVQEAINKLGYKAGEPITNTNK